jgi:5-methylcytosine-specific restriction endonuclease McrA
VIERVGRRWVWDEKQRRFKSGWEIYSRNWAKISYKRKIETEFSCEGCGMIWSYEQPIGLVTHHKDFQKWNNKKENLIVLCTECHGLAHKKGG